MTDIHRFPMPSIALALLLGASASACNGSGNGDDPSESEGTESGSTSTTSTSSSTTSEGSTSSSTSGESSSTSPADTTQGSEDTAGACGNGVLEPGEDCDGDDLGGLQSCNDLDPQLAGRLSCTAECALDMGACQTEPPEGVVLNELTASGGDGIEIYNFGRSPFDLSEYILTDDLLDPGDSYDPMADLEELQFPVGTVLEPGARLVVFQGGPPDSHLFGLAATGDAVTLLSPALDVVDFVAFGDGEADQSYCRLPDGPTGAWTVGCTPTFGDPNAP